MRHWVAALAFASAAACQSTEFQTAVGTSATDVAYAVAVTADQGYAVAGTTTFGTDGSRDANWRG